MTRPDLEPRIRELFLDDANTYGCAEVALVVLQEHFGLPDAGDSSAAMALNGGIAYTGGMCGAITGAALAAGRLAGRLIPDHAEAKRAARRVTQALIADFAQEFGAAGLPRALRLRLHASPASTTPSSSPGTGGGPACARSSSPWSG